MIDIAKHTTAAKSITLESVRRKSGAAWQAQILNDLPSFRELAGNGMAGRKDGQFIKGERK